MKRNNAIQTNHFKKTSLRYKNWFNQASKAIKRRTVRSAKASKINPIPTERLYPIVRCPTIRYNKKLRLGRGFTPEEIVAAGISDYFYARTVGISVDLRRRNMNQEAFDTNVNRLKEYMSKIVIYKSKKEALAAGAKQHVGTIMPVYNNSPVVETISKAEIASFK